MKMQHLKRNSRNVEKSENNNVFKNVIVILSIRHILHS